VSDRMQWGSVIRFAVGTPALSQKWYHAAKFGGRVDWRRFSDGSSLTVYRSALDASFVALGCFP